MLGWEFPPFFAGGAGIVCDALAKALISAGNEITFVMPRGPQKQIDFLNSKNSSLKIVAAFNKQEETSKKIRQIFINSYLEAYQTKFSYKEKINSIKKDDESSNPYGNNLLYEVYRFSQEVINSSLNEDFDVIHAHDWTTFLAGVELKRKTGKPLVVHVHITEFDKTGGAHADPEIYRIEREGMINADKVIAVSNKIKNRCIHNYFIDEDKIEVVHNATSPMSDFVIDKKSDEKIVLFAGRITMQKGPEYFVEAAKLVNSVNDKVIFVVAGDGDMLDFMKNKVRELGIFDNFRFLGFFDRNQAEVIFSQADVFVMPSISEPFGVVPYEAQIKKTPTVISKQSGISEVLNHTLKVDFWDVKEMANKILGLLYYKELHKEISEKGYLEAKNTTWDLPAAKCLNIYKTVVKR